MRSSSVRVLHIRLTFLHAIILHFGLSSTQLALQAFNVASDMISTRAQVWERETMPEGTGAS